MEPMGDCRSPNKRKDLSARFIPRMNMICLVMDEFILQRAEETLRHCVVVAVTLPTHTQPHAERGALPLMG